MGHIDLPVITTGGQDHSKQPLSPEECTPDYFPEGGFRAWATAFGGFLVQFCTYGYTISFGVYQDFYGRTYLTNQSPSTIAWIGSVNAFLFEICGLISGQLYDRGYVRQLVIGASLLQVISLFMLSLAKPDQYYQVFLSQGIGSGCAAGLLYIPSMAVVSQYFRKRREMVMTFVASGACLGAVVHPIMLNNTLNGRLGFANGVRASAALISGLLFIACLLIKPRFPPSKASITFLATAKKCAHDPPYIYGTAGLTIFAVGFYYPLFYLQLDSATHGLSKTFSFYSLVIMNTSSFVGQLTSGLLVECFGVPRVLTVSTSAGTVLLFSLIGLRTLASVVVIGILYGYSAGIFQALWAPILAVLSPDPSDLGARMGISYAFMALGGLIGPPISGALLTGDYIWWRGAVFNGIMAAIGCSCFIAMQIVLRHRDNVSR
ncbi:major facilitator superfamily domain-containing protein [Suillus discolor]|uniref:Major facilitator superfamily domain-containing protein n=1 Tax=Suillus discolor TaxID=1912936 RepID=A0A9P7JNX8_9AGAM|nr:major facilitator superfamily domain-containing protein [Suillus discolor]KAG2093152.1 major facilitator superfamily domain-containing protein [Suillus discolor]